MNNAKKVEFLQQVLATQIKKFRTRRIENQRAAVCIKLFSTTLAATTTVLLGLNNVGEPIVIKNVALCFSALVTLLSTWDSFFNYNGLWIRFNITVTRLYELKSELDYLLCNGIENLKEEQLDELYSKYKLIHQETNNNWVDLIKEYKSKESK